MEPFSSLQRCVMINFPPRPSAPAPRASGGLAGLMDVITGKAPVITTAPLPDMIVAERKAGMRGTPPKITSLDDLVAGGMIPPGLATQIIKS